MTCRSNLDKNSIEAYYQESEFLIISPITIFHKENATMGVKRACSIAVPVEAIKTPKCQCICYKCRIQFELPEPQSLQEEKGAVCPECRSEDIQIVYAPSCSIDTPGKMKMLMWKYLCHNCRVQFELPVPSGPKEEKETVCPECGSRDIQTIRTFEHDNCPPGG